MAVRSVGEEEETEIRVASGETNLILHIAAYLDTKITIIVMLSYRGISLIVPPYSTIV